jgi:hypothetical protein
MVTILESRFSVVFYTVFKNTRPISGRRLAMLRHTHTIEVAQLNYLRCRSLKVSRVISFYFLFLVDEFDVDKTADPVKRKTVVKVNSNPTPRLVHFTDYVLDLDVETYFKLKGTFTNVINFLTDVLTMFEKNKEKILKPRGDGKHSSNLSMY